MRSRYERLYTLADAIRSEFKPLDKSSVGTTGKASGLMSQNKTKQDTPVVEESSHTLWQQAMRGED
jgi:hypothetical protein